MSQAGVVTRLAVRELWITFRMLVVLVGFAGAGALVALLPAPLPDVMQRLALALGAAAILVAVLAAWSIGAERAHGRAGWLVTRSVSRGTLLVGWFTALASLAVVGTAMAGLLGWLAASGVSLRLDGGAFAAAVTGVAATVLSAIALGLLAGTLFRVAIAVPVTLLVAAASGAAAWLVPGVGDLLPGAAMVDLGSLREGMAADPSVWRATGAALVTAALLLSAARIALERADL